MASLECAHEYQNALEEGPVRAGDLLNVPAGFLNKLWVVLVRDVALRYSP